MTATNYIWDFATDSYLMEKDDGGNTTAVYTNEPVQYGHLISQKRDDVTSYYHFDGQGSTRQLTDDAATVSDTYTYSGFGATIATTGFTVNPFAFLGSAGYFLDRDTSHYYARPRSYYNPANGRWIDAGDASASASISECNGCLTDCYRRCPFGAGCQHLCKSACFPQCVLVPGAKMTCELAITAAGMFCEPWDWACTIYDICDEPTDVRSYIGLCPAIPSGVGKACKKLKCMRQVDDLPEPNDLPRGPPDMRGGKRGPKDEQPRKPDFPKGKCKCACKDNHGGTHFGIATTTESACKGIPRTSWGTWLEYDVCFCIK
jgi:hypothetical protein